MPDRRQLIAMPDTASSPTIKIDWILGLIAAFLIFVVIATYSSRMAKDTPDYDAGRRAERLAILKKQQDSDRQTLTTADWIDPAKNLVRIPIDEAIPQAIVALRSKPVQMGAEIPGATPAPNIIPAATKKNGPAGSTKAPSSTNAAPTNPPVPTADAPNK
jgi:hypothetical protein